MSTPEELAKQAEAVGRVRAARVRRDKANDELRREIVAAFDSGAATADIAAAAELTRQRIHQMTKER